MKEPNKFKESALANNIKYWRIHNCSICGYPCGYLIVGDEVYYDSGCDCVSYTNVQKRSWDDLARQYNMQTHPDVISEYNDFWGFSDEIKKAQTSD